MTKKKKTLLISILVILLLIVFLSGFTFAKYYTEYHGETSLSVAKWNFNVTGWDSEKTNNMSLLDMKDNSTELKTLAPGFSGVTTLELTAEDSDVDVEYHIKARENISAPTNMYFQATKNDVLVTNTANTIPENYTSLVDLAEDIQGIMTNSDTVTIKIYAIWPYEIEGSEEEKMEANKQDTRDAENAEEYRFSLTVIGSQV